MSDRKKNEFGVFEGVRARRGWGRGSDDTNDHAACPLAAEFSVQHVG